ncbi:hypothetical protein M2451_003800 [Dysgonomonas sp. PFB1-18]|uniref:hypothetical protein n=1 Tax=unclassified Dysgonomonas TaxID=2630389 RepID=UPI002475D9F0|nr:MULTISPECIES: hypothetical protein [unclassified Dysgonomonas]MDH6310936.1 hypothetical protein [Dysgonomonas sp. PF1-14]MDH6340849.1 hypothetical protein [Dysgonomonas sp. PF1-16]MDH6382459.1 hypothetical protein [Dysgonomonas sp. PFB1-18]MDH6399808.1 hypothetical protein [Dysgonomonas sp. PF1-23]
MKRIYFIIYGVLFLLAVGCTKGNPYESLISDYAQTDRHGTWTDIQFEAIEIEELAPITVSDSLEILKEIFESDKALLLKNLDHLLKSSEKDLDRENKSRIKSSTMIDISTKRIRDTKHRIDSVSSIQFSSVYDKESSDKVLLQPVRCHYSYVFPQGNPVQKRTDIFYFTAEKNKIVKQKQIKQ